ncbi:Extended-spectrum beta-lactamase PER-1 [Dyadobacter sp. CECT 9623]|uniref:Beta-lactamase n=1 Tax=Dyadobacter linearis TaxID=2823330 RepID=A0ABN7R376_9BACT|nr:class A beta-lactamase, subclass A2 [Dyadobacter sp. CECT 9623]CAG5068413.1 Extended-spectrum beta-lactamase PER-1 [Dyadobacter sp. CECT 9623]
MPRSIYAYLLIICCIFFTSPIFAQNNTFKTELATISKEANGTVGIGIMDLKTGKTAIQHGDHKFPMQSVFKFPLAMAVLDQVDKGKITLTQKVRITKEDLLPKTHSPMKDKYPEGNIDLTVADLLSYTVSESDNIACDLLFKLAGGTKVVNDYVHKLGVKNIEIVANEEEMTKGWDIQYKNFSTPGAMLQLLSVFYKGKNLSKASSDYLWKIMIAGPTGANRIKSQLPENTIVAHKTGTSGKNEKGTFAATNDVGIVKLPGGKDLAIVVFVSDSNADIEKRELVIAKVAKAAAEHFPSK